MQLIAMARARPIDVVLPPVADSVPVVNVKPVPTVTFENPPDPLPDKIDVPDVAGA